MLFPLPSGLRAWIEDVVVDAEARGRGVGAALNLRAIQIARDAGARTVDLTSRPDREAANRLYARLGFGRRTTNVYRRAQQPESQKKTKAQSGSRTCHERTRHRHQDLDREGNRPSRNRSLGAATHRRPHRRVLRRLRRSPRLRRVRTIANRPARTRPHRLTTRGKQHPPLSPAKCSDQRIPSRHARSVSSWVCHPRVGGPPIRLSL